MKFKYFDHTADVMFEGYGKTIEEAFENSGLAMFNVLTDVFKVKAVKKLKISVKADSMEKLLFDFLDELLFYLDTEHIIFCRFEGMKIKEGKGFSLICNASGDLASNYETHGDIKAPTYNEMKIARRENGFAIRVVVDI